MKRILPIVGAVLLMVALATPVQAWHPNQWTEQECSPPDSTAVTWYLQDPDARWSHGWQMVVDADSRNLTPVGTVITFDGGPDARTEVLADGTYQRTVSVHWEPMGGGHAVEHRTRTISVTVESDCPVVTTTTTTVPPTTTTTVPPTTTTVPVTTTTVPPTTTTVPVTTTTVPVTTTTVPVTTTTVPQPQCNDSTALFIEASAQPQVFDAFTVGFVGLNIGGPGAFTADFAEHANAALTISSVNVIGVDGSQKLYTSPPSQSNGQWVGLTAETGKLAAVGVLCDTEVPPTTTTTEPPPTTTTVPVTTSVTTIVPTTVLPGLCTEENPIVIPASTSVQVFEDFTVAFVGLNIGGQLGALSVDMYAHEGFYVESVTVMSVDGMPFTYTEPPVGSGQDWVGLHAINEDRIASLAIVCGPENPVQVAALPTTGAFHAAWGAVGLLLLLTGVTLIGHSRRKRHRQRYPRPWIPA